MKNNSTRLVGMLGFAMRAGKVTIGTDAVFLAMRNKKIRLVLVAADASEATVRRVGYKCEFYELPLMQVGIDGAELGRMLGKTYAPAVIGITDEGFAKEIQKAVPTDGDQQ